MDPEELIGLLKRSKFDLVLIVTTLLLVFSSQIFAISPLRNSGTITITEGESIPQETNYTLSTDFSPSVTSAVVLNRTLDVLDGIFFDVVTDGVSRFVFNFTLRSTENDTSVRIETDLGNYRASFDVLLGTTHSTYSLEPDMGIVRPYSNYWITYCRVRFESDIELDFKNVLLWAEFDTPVSPVILNWQSTEGEPLFDNPYTKWIEQFNPELRFQPEGGASPRSFQAQFQNRTIFLTPQNYTVQAYWGDRISTIPSFNLSIRENYTTTCTLRMRAEKLSLSLDMNVPLIHLEIWASRYSNDRIYDLYFDDSEIPDILYIPPTYDGYTIVLRSMDPLSDRLIYSTDIDVSAHEYIPESGISHHSAEIWLPYVHGFGLLITQQDLFQLSIAIILFSLILIRMRIYLSSGKSGDFLRDPSFIPVLIIGLSTFIPWFSSVREPVYGFSTTIYSTAFGPFPLIASWTEHGGILIDIPPSAIYWALASLIFFWLPLIYVNHYMTPPNSVYESSILLFSPLVFLGFVQVGLGVIFDFPFTTNLFSELLLVLTPTIFLCSFIVLKLTGRRNVKKRERSGHL